MCNMITCGEDHSHVTDAHRSMGHSCVEGTFTSVRCSHVEGHSCLAGARVWIGHSCLEGTFMHVRIFTYTWDIHMWWVLRSGWDIHVWRGHSCVAGAQVWMEHSCVSNSKSGKLLSSVTLKCLNIPLHIKPADYTLCVITCIETQPITILTC